MVARVGRSSLHPTWLQPELPRNWDLHLVPYEPLGPLAGVDCSASEVIPGPKWTGLRQVLNDWGDWRGYEHVWLPDDDIRADQTVINRMFDVAGALGLQLFAPALDASSHFAHFITMQQPRFYGRWVGFVEIMVPGFERAALEQLLPTFDLSVTGWGWGLDALWPKLLGYDNIGILDGTPVTHTRPVGQLRDPLLKQRLLDETEDILKRYQCRPVHTTYGAFGPDLQPVDLSPEQLLVELVDGARPLFAKDPRILPWLVSYQLENAPLPGYPLEGTP